MTSRQLTRTTWSGSFPKLGFYFPLVVVLPISGTGAGAHAPRLIREPRGLLICLANGSSVGKYNTAGVDAPRVSTDWSGRRVSFETGPQESWQHSRCTTTLTSAENDTVLHSPCYSRHWHIFLFPSGESFLRLTWDKIHSPTAFCFCCRLTFSLL